MNILVTGGAGFIGSHLVDRLLELGHAVSVADLATKYKSGVRYYGLDLSTDDWSSIEGDFDVIYHLAAQPYGRGSEEDPFLDLDYNTRAFLKMCYFAKLKGVKKVVYTSTMAVYGNNDFAKETDTLQPLSNYAVSKLYGEFCLKKFASECNFAFSILRLWNTYGPGQDLTNKSKGVVAALAQQVELTNAVKVTGSLDRYRDLVHVSDVVDALIVCLQDSTNGETLNVCSSEKITIRSVVDALIRAKGREPSEYDIANIGSHAGDQQGCVGDNSKLRSHNWKPTVTIENGFREFLNYIKNNI
jgi:UDP-glucose 4-epimerase